MEAWLPSGWFDASLAATPSYVTCKAASFLVKSPSNERPCPATYQPGARVVVGQVQALRAPVTVRYLLGAPVDGSLGQLRPQPSIAGTPPLIEPTS